MRATAATAAVAVRSAARVKLNSMVSFKVSDLHSEYEASSVGRSCGLKRRVASREMGGF
jgi:hypothetical protein